MSKDVILDKYARLYEIPNQLALLGHQVNAFCLSYQSHTQGTWDESDEQKSLVWHGKSYLGLSKPALLGYPWHLLRKLKKLQPDIIIAASDIPHIIIGAWCAKKLGKPFVADLYDNFESYQQARIPLFTHLFHHALDKAQLISTTSISLADRVRHQHPDTHNILAMPSVIDKSLFLPGEKLAARQKLNLPTTAKLIGTAGGLTKMKGIGDLFQAWDIIKERDDNVYLVLAGPTEVNTPLPDDDRVIYLGLLAHQNVVHLFQALDIGVLCIPDDDFGRYCFPQKAYEMLATELTIIASAVGDMRNLLNESQLYSPSDYKGLANRVIQQLNALEKSNIDIPDWKQSIAMLEKGLVELL